MDTQLSRQLNAITALLALIAVTRVVQVTPGVFQAAPISGVAGLVVLGLVAALALGLTVLAVIQGLRAAVPAPGRGDAVAED